MTEPRILIFADTMAGGGAERVLLDLLHNVFNPEMVDLYFYRLTGALAGELTAETTVFSLYPPEGKRLYERLLFHTPLRWAYERRRVRQLLHDRRYATVLSWLEGPASVMHSYVLDTIEARHITWVHTDLSANRWTLPFFGSAEREEAFYQRVDHIAFVSTPAREGFPFHTPAPQCVVPNIVDLDRVARLAQEQPLKRRRRFTLAFVGRLEHIKRPDRFVDTIAELMRRGIDVDGWMLGTGSLEQILTSHICKRGVAERVAMLGFVPNPYATLACADLLVLTSDAEGLPTVVIEAMSLGVPVVATRCAGVEELLGEGDKETAPGVVTDFSPEALADAIEEIVDAPNRRAAMQVAARQKAQAHSPENIAKTIFEVLFANNK